MPDPAPTDPTPPTPTPAPAPTPDPPTPELGDAGKRAIEAEREARKTAEAHVKRLDAELAKLREGQMSETEKAIKAASDEASTEADKRWLDRIVRAEAKAAAAGKVVDVDTAVRLLDLSAIPVKDGEVDSVAMAKAIDALVESKPFLRAVDPGGKPPTPTMPAGPRGPGNGQITREQLKTMPSADIEAARVRGDLDHLLKG